MIEFVAGQVRLDATFEFDDIERDATGEGRFRKIPHTGVREKPAIWTPLRCGEWQDPVDNVLQFGAV